MSRELETARELRRIADLVQQKKHIGVAYVFVDENDNSECGGVIDQQYQTKEFFDRLVYELKTTLFESLED